MSLPDADPEGFFICGNLGCFFKHAILLLKKLD